MTRVSRMRRLLLRTATAALALASTAVVSHAADALRITPGAWALNRLTRLPAGSEPRLRSTIECIRAEMLDPETLAGDIGACRFVDQVLSEGTLTWRVRCGDVLAGIGELTVADDRAHGGVHFAEAALPETGVSEMAWSANRLGPCPTFTSRDDDRETSSAPERRPAAPVVRPHTER